MILCKTLEEVTPRSCRCPLPGSAQGQAGSGFEQPSLAKYVPAYGNVV